MAVWLQLAPLSCALVTTRVTEPQHAGRWPLDLFTCPQGKFLVVYLLVVIVAETTQPS